MKIKVCGMTSLVQMHELEEMGVGFAGMIFYPKSPRYVLGQGLKASEVKKAGLQLKKVGVFVDEGYDEIMRKVDEFGLDLVQLHGHESPYECSRLADHISVVKAFRFTDTDEVPLMIRDFNEDADMFLFDAGVKEGNGEPVLYGGTGRKFNWNRLKGLQLGKPFFLSGGIGPGDAEMINELAQDAVSKDLFAVDINSRFETSPGIKDRDLIKKFIGDLIHIEHNHY